MAVGADAAARKRTSMITYSCSAGEQAFLVRRLRRIVEATHLPARVGQHRDGFGVFVAWTVSGRGKDATRRRSAAHWALMDAEAVLGLRSTGAYASTCRECGATGTNYDHSPEFCAALVSLAREFEVPLRVELAACGECNRSYFAPDPRSRVLAGLCDECYSRAAGEAEREAQAPRERDDRRSIRRSSAAPGGGCTPGLRR